MIFYGEKQKILHRIADTLFKFFAFLHKKSFFRNYLNNLTTVPKVKAWLVKHPRFHMHFTPTGSSWMNLVERFFRDISEDCIREGSFESVSELVKSINAYLEQRNANPKPYRWKAKGADILAKIQRARLTLKNTELCKAI